MAISAQGSLTCPRCGAVGVFGQRFCRNCGTALPPPIGAATTPAEPPRSSPAPAASRRSALSPGLSLWWIIVPTLVLAYLRRDPASTVVAALIGAGLRFAQSYQGIPAPLRGFLRYLPAVQILVVFVLLGGSLTTALWVVGTVAVAVVFRNPLIRALRPWWRLQASIPMIVRRAIAFGLPFLIGYYYGQNAGGAEYTATLLSVSLGTLIGFMMLFTPPGVTHPLTSPPA